jgi:dimethylamine/trimethylamine dehydrogenase
VLVTMRLPNDGLYHDLMADEKALEAAGIKSVIRIGDCYAPSTIAAAVYAGHRCAREMDEPEREISFDRELVALAPS